MQADALHEQSCAAAEGCSFGSFGTFEGAQAEGRGRAEGVPGAAATAAREPGSGSFQAPPSGQTPAATAQCPRSAIRSITASEAKRATELAAKHSELCHRSRAASAPRRHARPAGEVALWHVIHCIHRARRSPGGRSGAAWGPYRGRWAAQRAWTVGSLDRPDARTRASISRQRSPGGCAVLVIRAADASPSVTCMAP